MHFNVRKNIVCSNSGPEFYKAQAQFASKQYLSKQYFFIISNILLSYITPLRHFSALLRHFSSSQDIFFFLTTFLGFTTFIFHGDLAAHGKKGKRPSFLSAFLALARGSVSTRLVAGKEARHVCRLFSGKREKKPRERYQSEKKVMLFC